MSKRIAATALCALFLTGHSRAAELTWDDPLLWIDLFAVAADYSTTMDFVRYPRPGLDEEQGLIAKSVMGRHPSQASVRYYFAGVALSHLALRYTLPKPYGDVVLYVGIATHARAAYGNYHLGARFSF